MEEIMGVTLRNFINKQHDNKIIKVFLNIIKALIYLNIELCINHNDVDIDNIMITHDDTVIIIDFGSACKIDHPNLKDYEKFMEVFYNIIKWHLKRGTFPHDSNTNNLFIALEKYKDIKSLSCDGGYKDVYNNFEQHFKVSYHPMMSISVSNNILYKID
jgi:serine/threonine protein kinase